MFVDFVSSCKCKLPPMVNIYDESEGSVVGAS